MACWEGKKYKLDKSENFDEYMKELGKFMSLVFPLATMHKMFRN